MYGMQHVFKKFTVCFLFSYIQLQCRVDINKSKRISCKIHTDDNRIGIGDRPYQSQTLLKLLSLCFLCS